MAILLGNKPVVPVQAAYPLVPLRDTVPFPFVDMQVFVGRKTSREALFAVVKQPERYLVVVAQKDLRVEEPTADDLYQVGVLAKVEQMVQTDSTILTILHGLKRVRITKFLSSTPFLKVTITPFPPIDKPDEETKVLLGHLYREVKKAFSLGKPMDLPLLNSLFERGKIEEFVNQVAYLLEATVAEKQEILEAASLKLQLQKVTERLLHEIKVIQLERSLEQKTRARFERGMRRAILEERKREIEKELAKLGVTPKEEQTPIKELEEKLAKTPLPVHAKQKAQEEIKRLKQMPLFSPEATVIRNYLDFLFKLPWEVRTKDNVDLAQAKKVLEADHYGLKQVKERILEYLAVMKLRRQNGEETIKDSTRNILCFIGPPGVGKTSIGRSIAKALGRKFVRVSLGGVRDEAEIRGHRRTYIGALPGRILQGIKTAGSKNPVFMLDEVDKIGTDFRGDPAAALLEVLDPEQNKEFVDHYLDIPFDLSEVFFILTGNVIDTIPPALRDRLEIIEFSGYTEEEKLQIAKKFLIPKQIKAHGLTPKQFVISDKALLELIRHYTREAGVRELERNIAALCRKIAKKIAEGKETPKEIDLPQLRRFLGPAKFLSTLREKKDEVGVATGLAWTEAGGEILFVEVSLMPGKGSLYLTGQLGEVMKESCQAALTWVRSNWQFLEKQFGVKIDKNFAKKHDIHVHVPAGAVPKDGPSAGVAIATALTSVLINKPVKKEVGMTGEITLRGRVLPIGGVKEKILAAHRSGLSTVILPRPNRKDLREIPSNVRHDLNFVFVSSIPEVLRTAIKNRKN